MSRQIVLDTETTGLNARLGDRVIEIGCVELVDRRLSGRHFHHYVNPERKSEAGALAVHGISDEFLLDKPKFAEIAAEFVEYIKGAELVIHNAAFDVEFLDQELGRCGMQPLSTYCEGVTDSLRMAKELHPGKRNSLDALCERYEIDNSHRTLHGALLDAELLAEVYLSMTRGQDSLLSMGQAEAEAGAARDAQDFGGEIDRVQLSVLRASEEELAEHERVLAGIGKAVKGKALWHSLMEPPAGG